MDQAFHAREKWKMVKAALYTACAIFAINALVQVVRLITGFDWTAAGFAVPLWVHVPGGLIAVGLAVWMFMAAKRAEEPRPGV